MLYSHLRFFIAGVEMPVSGQIYVTGGTLNTTLTYTLTDPDAFNASPLARTRFEDVPVRLAGSVPTTTLSQDDRTIESGTADSNYNVLFDGTASLTLSYSPDTKRIDIAVTAVPGTVKALNSIVYTSLSVGSMTGSVAGAQDSNMTRQVAEASGSQVLNTGFGPNNFNTNMFLKRVVAGEKTKEISRPTDMIEFAISNILKYAGSAFMKTGNQTPLLFDDKDRNFREVYLDLAENEKDKAADRIPEYLKNKWSAKVGKPDHGDTDYVYDPKALSMVLPDIIFRTSVADDVILASKTEDPDGKKMGDLDEVSDTVKMDVELSRTAKFLDEAKGGFWFGNAKELAYLFKNQKDKLTGYRSRHCLPKCVADTLASASPMLETAPEIREVFADLARGTGYARRDGTTATSFMAFMANRPKYIYNPQSPKSSNYWRFYGPEFVAILNAFMKSYLTTIGLSAVSYTDKNTIANLLELLYTDETSKDFPQFHQMLKDTVTAHVAELYPSILMEYYNGMQHVFAETYSYEVFNDGCKMNPQLQKKSHGKLYFENLHPSESDWAHMQAKGGFSMSLISTLHEIANNREPSQVENSYLARLQTQDQAYAWYSMLRDFIISGIKSACDLVASVRSKCETGMVIGYTFTSSFSDGKSACTQAPSLYLSKITDLLSQIDNIITGLDPDKPYVADIGDPSLFDIKAARSILSRAAQNKIGSIDFMRLSTEDKKDAAVYPNLALASLQEFQQLVSNTSQAAGNGKASLYQMLTQLYNTLRLSLTTPLNKPYAIQHNKAVDASAEVIDGSKSVLEMMVVPTVETWAVPKCNVFCVDRSLPVTIAYNQIKNVTDILIRYSEPVDIITGTDTGGSLPATYYRFSLNNPGKIYKVADPKAAFSDNRSYDQATDASGYKSGYVYDMYSTATVDVSQEVAALTKLCSKPKEPEPDAEAIAAAAAQVPASLKFSMMDIGSAINRSNLNVIPQKTLTINIKSKGTVEDSKTGGYQYKDTQPGSECEYITGNSTIANSGPRPRKDNFKAIYTAVCFQVTLNYLSKHIADLRNRASNNASEDEIKTYIQESIFPKWNPQYGTPLYDTFKAAATSFINDYLFKEFPDVQKSVDMPTMRYKSGRWDYTISGWIWNSHSPYTGDHFETFLTQLFDPSARPSAEELLSNEIWTNALTKILINDAFRRDAEKLKQNEGALWVFGQAKYTVDNVNYDTDDFHVIFAKSNYLRSSLGPAYDHQNDEESRVKTDDFFKSMSGQSIDVYFDHKYVDAAFSPYVSNNSVDTTDMYNDIILPVRQNIMHGVYRMALAVYGYYGAVTKCLDSTLKDNVQVKPVYTRELLNNIIQFRWTADHDLFKTSIKRLSASEALYMAKNNPTVDDSLFTSKGDEFELRVQGLLCTKTDLESWAGDEVFRKVNASIARMRNRKNYTPYDSPYLSYLMFNAAYLHIKNEGKGNRKDFYTLVTPYYYLEKTEDTKPEILPKMSSISMNFINAEEINRLGMDNKGNIAITEADAYNQDKSTKVAKSEYDKNQKKVLISIGAGSELRTERWRTIPYETIGQRNDEARQADWCPRRWPFVVWFDKGTKAGLIYYDMLEGGYSDLLSFGGIVQDNAFQPPVHYFNLGEPSDNDNWTSIGDIKVVFDLIKKMENPFTLNFNAFSKLKDNSKAYLLSPIPMDGDFKNYLACLNIPVTLLMYHLSTQEKYSNLIQLIDPRDELGAYMENRINQTIKFSKDAVPKTMMRSESGASGAGATSGADLKSAVEYSFRLLFQGDWTKACILPSAGNYNPSTGKRVDSGLVWAKAAQGTAAEDIVADAYDLRHVEGHTFRVHGGVDIGINGYSSTSSDKIKDNWVNNPYVPNQIHAPYDVKVVYSCQESNGRLTGYGFYAILLPDSDDQDLSQVGSEDGYIPVIRIAHLTPPTTINLNHIRALIDNTAAAITKYTPKVTEKQLAGYRKLSTQPCNATSADTYYFQSTKFNSAAVQKAGLTQEAKDYMAQLSKTFGRASADSLSKVIFKVPKGKSVGCIGSSGSSQGLHYHVECFMIPKSDPAVKNFYTHSVTSGILAWVGGTLSGKTSFEVPGASCEDWSVMSAKRTSKITELQSQCKFMNIHEFLSHDSTKSELWVNGMPDITPALSDHDMSMSNNLYTAPEHILVSVVDSRAYQEAVNRLCAVQVDPIILPYYDPYVVDGSMPAAVIYRNDVVLTKAAQATVQAANGRCNTSIMFTTGISVAKMLPLYFSAVSHIFERLSSSPEMFSFILDSVVFPFHSLDFYNKYAYSGTRAKVYYKEMFGKENFVFDWRDCVRIVIDDRGTFYSVKELIMSGNITLIKQAAKRSYSTDNGTLQIDVSGAMKSVANPNVLPKNQEQLMLAERAWDKANMFRLSMVNTDLSYMTRTDAAVPLTDIDKLRSGAYEEEAKYKLEQTLNVDTVAGLPATYYDWKGLFTVLRANIRTARRNVSN